MSEVPSLGGQLRRPGSPPIEPAAPTAAREPVVRHARKDGRSVAVLRAIDNGDSCVV